MAAGAAEALRSRKEPGEWRGNKGKHVLTTAVTNGLINKDPKKPQTHHVIDTTLSGLDGRQASKHRSRSQDRDGTSRTTNDIKKIAAAGALAWAGKEIYDRFDRSRSRARDRGYDSRYSDDGRRGSKKRSKSVSDYIHRGMAALGLEESNDRRRNRSKDRDGRSDRRERDYHRQRDYSDVDRDRGRSFRYDEYSDSDGDSDYRRDYLRRDRGSTDLTRTRSLNSSKPPTGAPRYIGYAETASHEDDCSCSNSDTDLGDSSDEKKKQKKLKRDMLLASGLATVASIHAAHGVYESVNKRKQRMQQLKNGEITPEQARKGRIKANTLDAASIGIAALGIKGAYGEWKEVNEKRKETNNFRHECVRRAVKRELKRERSTRGSSLPSHRSSNETQNTLENGYSGSHNVLSYHDGNPYGATTETPAITY
ncbi:hypothetical protein N7462_002625 [Penicillium macrosclerotiorum]|uniref:uncharacterized protein n=1 Tax=Penicillium macrosclerotiorum TaxID=303699 RepID=UPI002549A119|nr:uncharacterized protein N7462_002625 [Penicillium macrosclerotiorum]KAJ5693202.1 hypothetical protein N7462_002625 [Penicillium macrosclerotiorum]